MWDMGCRGVGGAIQQMAHDGCVKGGQVAEWDLEGACAKLCAPQTPAGGDKKDGSRLGRLRRSKSVEPNELGGCSLHALGVRGGGPRY